MGLDIGTILCTAVVLKTLEVGVHYIITYEKYVIINSNIIETFLECHMAHLDIVYGAPF